MLKEELIKVIEKGETIPKEYNQMWIGQGMGYKKDVVITDKDLDENEVIYIPEYGYDDKCKPLTDCIYSKKDLLEICKGDEDLTEFMWETLDWQSPETLYEEWDNNGILDEHFTKEKKSELKNKKEKNIKKEYNLKYEDLSIFGKFIVASAIIIGFFYLIPLFIVGAFLIVLFGTTEGIFNNKKGKKVNS